MLCDMKNHISKTGLCVKLPKIILVSKLCHKILLKQTGHSQ